MSNMLTAIGDFISILVLGAFILLFAGEIKLALQKQALKGTPKMQSFTERMTGEKLDLSSKRLY